MTTKTRHVAYTGSYLVGYADVGDPGMPGSGASEKRCWLRINNRGRWVAECSYSTGCNQGYYQENYCYGPWEGRGDTPQEAVSSMLSRVDDEYRDSMRKASHDAMNDAEENFGSQWESTTWAEAGIFRQQRLINSDRHSLKYVPFQSNDDDEIDAWRSAEISRLEKRLPSKLSHISDEELLAECKLRGLSTDA